MKKPATARQEEVLGAIEQHTAQHGYPPTLREIGLRVGIRSTNGVEEHLRALERKGWLTREAGKARALKVTR